MLLSNFFFGLPSNYCDISGSTNIKIVKLYICIHTLIARHTFLSVYYSDRTNSESHSGPLHQLVTSNCAQLPSPSNTRFYLHWPSTIYVAAECAHSVECVNGVSRWQERLIFQEKREFNLILCIQQWVNILSQTFCLGLFLPFYRFFSSVCNMRSWSNLSTKATVHMLQ